MVNVGIRRLGSTPCIAITVVIGCRRLRIEFIENALSIVDFRDAISAHEFYYPCLLDLPHKHL